MHTIAENITKPQTYLLQDNDFIIGEYNSRYTLRLRDMPQEHKPREKLLAAGPSNLSVAELIAILFGVGTKKEDVLAMSQRIVKEYGEKTIVDETNPANLAKAADIPLIKACQIVAGFELGRRYFQKQAGQAAFVRNANQAYHYLKGMGHSKKEQLRGLYLNSRYQVVRDEVISVGSLTSNIIHPREVFQPAIEYGAAALIIAHNHPSGSLQPTDADIKITRTIIDAGKLLGIDVLDHLIITSNRYVSVVECIANE